MAYVSFLLLVLFELVIDASFQGVNSAVWRGIKMSDDVKGVLKTRPPLSVELAFVMQYLD